MYEVIYEIKHGWYSQQSEKDGNTVYIYLNDKQEEIKCTSVNHNLNNPPYDESTPYHLDYKYMGQVKTFLKNQSNEQKIVNKCKRFILQTFNQYKT
jgi:hypothetical protein